MTTATLAIRPGVYHAVRVGLWIDEETGAPVWSADIALNMGPDGPDAVVGNGPTLQFALNAAAANLVAFVEKES